MTSTAGGQDSKDAQQPSTTDKHVDDNAKASELHAASAAEAVTGDKSALPLTADGKQAVGDGTEPPLTKDEMVQEALTCPCIANMKDGPCGSPFLVAYECFLRSETDPQGSDCLDKFVAMHDCMKLHPEEYDLDDDNEDYPNAKKDKPKGELISSTVSEAAPVVNDAPEAPPIAAASMLESMARRTMPPFVQRGLARIFEQYRAI